MCRIGLLVLLFCAGAVDPVLAEFSSKERSNSLSQRRRALLVGVGSYRENQSGQLADLQGPPNDIRELRRILIERLQFQPEDVSILIDRAASHERIAAAFEHLARQTGSRDIVYIHFSGHAVQLLDDDGDEADDDFDEAIVPFGKGEIESIAIRDDLFQRWLDALPSPNVVVVIDTCYAGGVTRGISNSGESPGWPASIHFKQLALSTHRVLFAASGTTTQALDGKPAQRAGGLFSHAFGRALESSPPESTVARVWDGVRLELAKLQLDSPADRVPEPEIDASPSRLSQPLFSDLPIDLPARRAFPATVRGTTLMLDVPASVIPRGASSFELFRFDERQWVAGRGLATARRAELETDLRVAQIQGQRGTLPPRVWVVPIDATEPLTIGWGDSSQVPSITRLMVALAAARQAGLVYERVWSAPLTVHVTTPSTSPPRVQAQLRMLNDAVVVGQFVGENPEQLADGLLKVLPIEWSATAMVALVARVPSSPGLETRIVRHSSAADSDTRSGDFSGAEIALEVRSLDRAYLTVISVDGIGRVNCLLPNPLSERSPEPLRRGIIPAHVWARIPESDDSVRLDPFSWRFADPVAPETLLVFASPSAESACALRRSLSQIGADFPRSKNAAESCTATLTEPPTLVTVTMVPIG